MAELEGEELGLREILKHLDRESAHFVVRVESVPSSRKVTVVEPHELIRDSLDLPRLLHQMKERLGTGGSVENGRMILHGDHREQVRAELVKFGVAAENIELI